MCPNYSFSIRSVITDAKCKFSELLQAANPKASYYSSSLDLDLSFWSSDIINSPLNIFLFARGIITHSNITALKDINLSEKQITEVLSGTISELQLLFSSQIWNRRNNLMHDLESLRGITPTQKLNRVRSSSNKRYRSPSLSTFSGWKHWISRSMSMGLQWTDFLNNINSLFIAILRWY